VIALAQQNPHRRFNPLKREWVLVSPHRTQRPWQGQTETKTTEVALTYDPTCYLCPGNVRAGGVRTDKYTTTYVFENDFAALKPDAPLFSSDEGDKGLLLAEGESGVCRVICFSPRHDLTLAKMSIPEIRAVVDVWSEQYAELGVRDEINYVQIFENRGAMMGASNPHPHGQLWASRSIPDEVTSELAGQREYLANNHAVLLCEYQKLEESLGERVVSQNESFLAIVPFWAVWPFEVMILPRRHVATLQAFTD
jgi:UDPglucose--hexose-1-phosphate uridylyltransferase